MLRQILREFWFPVLAALSWTAFKLATRDPNTACWETALANFPAAAAIASWWTGQYFRIRKQTHVESRLGEIVGKLEVVVTTLKDSTDHLAATISGGDSFCYGTFAASGNDESAHLKLVLHGTYPIYDLRVRIVDLDFPDDPDNEEEARIGTLPVDVNAFVGNAIKLNLPKKHYTVQFMCRGGIFTQHLRSTKVGDRWVSATRVYRGKDVVFESVGEGYPRQPDASVDWSKPLPSRDYSP